MRIVRGAKGEKGHTGQRGIPGPPGPAGKTGEEGSQGPRGWRGKMGSQGPEGVIGPAGKVRNFADMAKQLHYVDHSIDNIYREMGTHITRLTQLQRELDSLRNTVRRLGSSKVIAGGSPTS
jgi:Collagen triple helix repeat (20 copies)